MNYSLKKEPTAEIRLYREQALRAASNGNEELAGYWRLACDEALFVLRQQETTAIFQPYVMSCIHEIACLAYSNQEANYYFHHQGKKSASAYWAFNRNKTSAAGSGYRYWIALAHAQASKNFEQEIKQASAAAIKYSSSLLEASRCAQQAASLLQRAHKPKHHDHRCGIFLDTLVVHRWSKAAYAAAHLATIHIDHEAASLETHSLLEHAWSQRIDLASEVLSLRIKVAEATQIGAEQEAIEYSLAAFRLSHALSSITDGAKDILKESNKQLVLDVQLYKKMIYYRTAASKALSLKDRSAGLWKKAAFGLKIVLIAKRTL